MEEKRQASLDSILIQLGEIKAQTHTTFQKVDELEKRVTIQNGRVAKGELWRAYMTGAIAILSAFMVPVILMISSEIIKNGFLHQ